MRQPNSRSPRPHNQRKPVQRRPDPGTDDFMRFIREYQLEKQPTNLGLLKKAPLPSIGQSMNFTSRRDSSGFFDKSNDSSSVYEENMEDSKVAFVHEKSSDPRRDPILQEVLTLTRERTKDHIILSSLSNGMSLDVNRNHTHYTRQNSDHISSRTNIRAPKTLNGIRSNLKRHSKQLPPIPRDDIPERPSAPSPSLTPPLPDSDEGFIMEEPIDFIDSS